MKALKTFLQKFFIRRSLEFLEEAFPNLDIYSQCSSFDPRDTMAERDKLFFKDGITDQFSEAVSRLNLLFCKFKFYND